MAKYVKDMPLKTGVNGNEDILIQDNDGVTKRIKASELMDAVDLSNYYNKAEVDGLVNNVDLSEYYTKGEIDSKLDDVDLEGYYTKEEVDAELDILKSSVSDGKELIASAITGKGVQTSSNDSFQTMANNIYAIESSTNVPVERLSLSMSSATLKVGDTIRLTPIFTPSNATNQAVTWSISNPSVCSVSNGSVIALATGYSTITATSLDGGFTASCSLEVQAATVSVTGVSLDKTELNLLVGSTYQLQATVYPNNATNKTVTFSCSSSNVTVNSSGLVTAISDGSAVVTVTTNDGQYKATCIVKVTMESTPEDDITGSETLEDGPVRNLVPYLATYYVEPTINTDESLKIDYFVTDYYGRSYTQNSNFYRYSIVVKCDGAETKTLWNVPGGDNSLTIGPFNSEGIYHYSIVAVDQYGRSSHEVFNYVRVKNTSSDKTYTVTSSDISSYGITYNVSREVKQFVDCKSVSTNEAIEYLIETAYNNATVPSGKYTVIIPDRDGSGVYKGINCDWSRCKVKYSSDYNIDAVKQECANNRIKIQKLLEDKVAEGYNKVIMHKATYVIDENPIQVPSGLKWDLNGATIKMNPFTGQGALMVQITDAVDTELYNGTIEGDYFAHDYANSEYNSEWVSGVELGGSCKYCSVHDLTIKDITGYGLQNGISNVSSNGYSYFNPVKVGDMEKGDIDKTTGQNIDCSYRLRSNQVDISGYQGKSDFLTVSIHLNYQGNEFDTWNMMVYFYNTSGQFIKAINAYQYRQIKIPEGAHYARTVMYGDRVKTNWEIYYHFLRVPTHCNYTNVTIDNARCVGMAQGQMKDFLVKDCTISNSGQSSATCSYDAEDGWDGMQDAFFKNFNFVSCPNNGYLTCAGHNFVIEDSNLYKLYMWERSRWTCIRNCEMVEATIRGGGESNIVQHGIARFNNNTVTGLTYSLNFVSNILKNCTLSNKPQSGILIDCTVGGSSISKEVCNNDINNPSVDDYGSLSNADTGNLGGDTGDDTKVSSISVTNSPLSIPIGGSARINYTVYPTTATNKSVSFSSNSNYISISSDGVVSVSSSATAGTYTVTITTNDGGYSAACSIIVTDGGSSETIAVTGVTLVDSEVTMQVNESRTFEYSVQPESATNKDVYWYTASGNCSVDSATGVVTANYVGTDYINVVSYDGHHGASCKITIISGDGGNVSVTGVSLSSNSLSLNADESSTLTATITPSNATNKNMSWTSSNTNIATVDASGRVTGVSEGTCYITVTTQDGSYSASCQVMVAGTSSGEDSGGEVEPPVVSGVIFNNDSPVLGVGEELTLTLKDTSRSLRTVYAATGSISIGTYSGPSVTIKGEKVGSDYMNYILTDDTSGSIPVTVTEDGSGGTSGGDTTPKYGNISLSSTTSSINDNNSGSFSVKLDSAPTNDQIVYISSNSQYVTVSPSQLTFTSGNYATYQQVTYTASCNNNSSFTATLTLSSSNVSSKTFSLSVIHTSSGSGGSTGGDSGSGSTGAYDEKDSSGYVIVKYPATKKANPSYWCALGDSITAGTGAGGTSYSYANVAANKVGSVIYNYGIAGSCVNDGYNLALTEPGYADAFCNRYTQMADGADLITVLGSVNDHRADSKMGTLGSTDSTTFYGALDVLINGLKAKYPTSRIVFITPFKTADWNGTNMYGLTMLDFRNAIVAMCNKYELEVVDLFSVRALSWLVGLTSTPSLFYQYDYYHPTPDGHKAIADYIVEQMFGGTESGGSSGSTNVPVTGINVSEWDVKMEAGQSKTLTYEVTPSTATNKTVYWSNSNYSAVDISYTDSTITINAIAEGYSAVTATTADGGFTYVVHVNVSASSSSGGSTPSSGIANASETALTQQYSSSHEATPNAKISNLAGTAYYWKDKPRINPDGSFPSSTWNAFGHWMTSYIVEGSSYYDNVGLLLQNPKAWIWNTSTQSWDVLSSDFEWGSWYLEDFWDDGSSYIAGTTEWETGASGNHSTWVKIKQTSETSGRCFHPWGYQKDWRSNSDWANNGQPYIVTKIDFKLVKWDESGVDNLAYANLVVNSGGDWWSAVGATWQPDWSTNRDMCVGKYVKATTQLKRAWATNLPSSWPNGLPNE